MDNDFRLISFVAVFLILAVFEAIWPLTTQQADKKQRWPTNFGLLVLGAIINRLLLGAGLAGAAIWANAQHFGLFSSFSDSWIAFIGAWLLLDLAIYWQHVASHRWDFLWRFHRVHHADTALDVSSGIRFHPIEALLSAIYKMAIVMLLGAPLLAVLCFELSLNLAACFNHANIGIKKPIEKTLRKLLVTPAFHRIHHSPKAGETNSNYCFFIPWWDYLFGSYKEDAAQGYQCEVVGIDNLEAKTNPSDFKTSLLHIPLEQIR